MKSGELKRAKRRIRRDVLAARDALLPEERMALGERVVERFLALPAVERAGSVMAFWAFGSEVPTARLIERLHASGTTVALPRIEGRELVPVAFGSGDPTVTTPFGAEEPVDGVPLEPAALDVVAVPGLAFDRDCGRIGYGGGFYDRFLRGVEAFTVGLAFGLQVVDRELPRGHFDLRLDAVVTESDTFECSDLNSRSRS